MSDAASHRAEAERRRVEGDLEGAAMHQRRAVAMLRGGDPAALAHALGELAAIRIEDDAAHDAQRYLSEAFALYGEMAKPPPRAVADTMRVEAQRYWAIGDDEAALEMWRLVRDRYAALAAANPDATDLAPALAEAEHWVARIAALPR